MLQKERRGTLFIDNQRKLNFYLRAFWVVTFLCVLPPVISKRAKATSLHRDARYSFADAFDDFAACPAKICTAPTAAHAAAHLVYTREPLSMQQTQFPHRCFSSHL